MTLTLTDDGKLFVWGIYGKCPLLNINTFRESQREIIDPTLKRLLIGSIFPEHERLYAYEALELRGNGLNARLQKDTFADIKIKTLFTTPTTIATDHKKSNETRVSENQIKVR